MAPLVTNRCTQQNHTITICHIFLSHRLRPMPPAFAMLVDGAAFFPSDVNSFLPHDPQRTPVCQ